MKKFLLSSGVLGTFFLYALHLRSENKVSVQPIDIPNNSNSTQSIVTPTLTVSPTSKPSSGMGSGGGSMMNGQSMGMMGKYKDGTYKGPVTDGPKERAIVINFID